MSKTHLLPRKDINRSPVLPLLAALLVFASAGCARGGGKGTEGPPQVAAKAVKAAAPKAGSLQPSIEITGTIIPVREVDLFSKIPGRVERVCVKEGDKVSEGNLLVQLEENEYSAQVRQVEANLEQAKTNLAKARTGYDLQDTQVAVGIGQAMQGKLQAIFSSDSAKLQLENIRVDRDRMRRLYDRGAISKQTLENIELRYDTAKKQYETTLSMIQQARESVKLAQANTAMKSLKRDDISLAEAQIAALQASLDLARITLQNCRITAPISGAVTLKNVEKGEIVTSMSSAQPLIRITDNSIVHLEGDLGEDKIAYVHNGDSVSITMDSYADKTFKGRIETVVPSADLKTRAFRVKITIPNEQGLLKSGMFGRASILMAEMKGLIVPRPALIKVAAADPVPDSLNGTAKPQDEKKNRDSYYLFVNEGGKAKRLKVTVGTLTETQALITGGIKPDAEVIYLGQENLQDNDPVHVAR